MNDILLQRVGNEVQSEDRKFIVPFERNPYFVGREEFLSRVKVTLSDEVPKKYNHRVAIYGMGGVGKTQTAIEYVYTNRDFYERVYWITAVDRDSLLLGYRKIAEHIGLKALSNSDPVAIAEAVIGWLGEKSSWLVVLDNLDDISVAANCLPPSGPRRHTVITTRNPNTRHIPAEGLELPLFGEADALELLHTGSDVPLASNDPNEAPPEAREIVQEFGYLPLGIVQAAAFIRNYSGDFRTFLDDYQQNRKAVNSWVSEGNADYPRSLAATSTMSLNKLRNVNPIAVEIFQILAFLTPDGILIEFLQAGAESPALNDNLKRALLCRFELSTVLHELEKFSLLNWNRPKKTIAIHRLVQTVVKDEMSSCEFNRVSATAVELCLHTFPKTSIEIRAKLPTLRKYAGQFPALLVDPKIPPSHSLLTLLDCEGDYLAADGKADIGEPVLLRACSMSEEINGRDCQVTLSVKGAYAYCLYIGGKLCAAASLQEESFESCKRVLGEDHEYTLVSLNTLGLIYSAQGKLAIATEVGEICLEKMKRTAGIEHPSTLVYMSNLAYRYIEQGRYTEAVELLTFVVEKMPESHPDTFDAMRHLANAYGKMGKREEASRLLKCVVEKYTGFWGKDNPRTMSTTINYAYLDWEGGNKVDAIGVAEEVLARQRRILGASHRDTLSSIQNLAYIYENSGRQAEAADLRAELAQFVR
jgi:tetratricopeptide (TPR) repeat protein